MSVFKRAGSPYWYSEVVVRGHRVVRSTGETSRRAAEAFDRRLKEEVKKRVALEQTGVNKAKQSALSYTIDHMMGRYWLEHGSKRTLDDIAKLCAAHNSQHVVKIDKP